MRKRFRNISMSVVVAVAATLVASGTVVAATSSMPAAQTQPGNGVFDNFLIVVLGSVLLALLAAVAGGVIVALLAVGVSRFFRRNLPTDEEMSDLRAVMTTTRKPSQPLRIGPTAEPFVIGAGGFIVFLLLSSVVLASTPKPVQGTLVEEKPVTTGLPKEGDFTKIVSELPPGDPARGSKLYVSSGCSGCHSLEKDKRLVGPSFYNVFDHAKTAVPNMGAKEYIYQSIVDPNAHIVESYQAGLMPQTFASQFSPQQMADILAWFEKDHQGQP